MGRKTGIEWADCTWNPWQGCAPVSEGCDHCYMAREKKRYGQQPWKVVTSSARTLNMPRSTKRVPPGSFVFVCSWSDFFFTPLPEVKARAIARDIMFSRPDCVFLLLTKRVEEMKGWVRAMNRCFSDQPRSHIWLGVTAENQARADERIPELLDIRWPGKKFVSVEPMIGPVDLSLYLGDPTGMACCGDEPEYCSGCRLTPSLRRKTRSRSPQ